MGCTWTLLGASVQSSSPPPKTSFRHIRSPSPISWSLLEPAGRLSGHIYAIDRLRFRGLISPTNSRGTPVLDPMSIKSMHGFSLPIWGRGAGWGGQFPALPLRVITLAPVFWRSHSAPSSGRIFGNRPWKCIITPRRGSWPNQSSWQGCNRTVLGKEWDKTSWINLSIIVYWP